MTPMPKKLPRAEVEAGVELTPVQEGMLFHHLLEPDSQLYQCQLTLDLEGEITVADLQAAWAAVVRDHEVLRSVFRWQAIARPVQITLRSYRPEIHIVDNRGVPAPEQGDRWRAFCEADRATPLDLTEAPLRVSLVRMGPARAKLVLTHHHLLYDGWSGGIILRELVARYDDMASSSTLTPRRRPPFRDYVRWLRSRRGDEDEAFWSQALNGWGGQGPLPILRREAETGGPGRFDLRLDPSALLHIDTLCKEYAITAPAVIYAAVGLVLQRWHDRPDIVFGTTVSGRSAPIDGLDQMVGLFIQTPPLRFTSGDDDELIQLARNVHRSCVERMAFVSTPLVDIHRYAGIAAGDQLFDTIVVIENYPLAGISAERLKIVAYESTETTSFPLTVLFNLLEADATLSVLYTRGEIDDFAAQRFAAAVGHVLHTMVQSPRLRTSSLDLITTSERESFLQVVGETDRDGTTIIDAFEEMSAQYPERPALWMDGRLLAYGALHERATRLAHELYRLGVRSGDVVGLCLERSPEMVVGALGILMAGAAYLPIEPDFPEKRLAFVLDASGAKLVACRGESATRFKGIAVLNLEQWHSWPERGDVELASVAAEQLAYVIYTSGSTGRPKGVMVHHDALFNRLRWAQKQHPLMPGDVLLQKTSIMFDVSVWELFGWILGGATLALMAPGMHGDPRVIAQIVEQARVSVLHFVPSMLQVFLEYLEQTPDLPQLRSLKRVHTSGETLSPGLLRRFQRLAGQHGSAQLINLYGPTEATVDVTFHDCVDDDAEGALVPIGRPIDNTRIYLLDSRRRLVPRGVPGELFIAGRAVALGYLNEPELTRERFVADPFVVGERMYATGDLARQRPTGEIDFLGRRDGQVKLRGFRIELSEIEAVLGRHPSVATVAAVVMPDPTETDSLVTYVVLRKGASLTLREAQSFLKDTLPAYMLPEHLQILPAMPLSRSGKIDRSRLPPVQPVVTHAKQQIRRASTALEAQLAQLWCEVLGLEQADPDTPFFELGGNSLKAVRVCARISKAIGVELPVATLFHYPTIHRLAEHLAAPGGEEQASKRAPEPSLHGDGPAQIAVVGLALRVPGADTPQALWDVLVAGEETLSSLSDEQLARSGVAEPLRRDKRYVARKGIIEGGDCFDAALFGYSAREAQCMDPQLRLLHECVWAALEDAGRDPRGHEDVVGLYASSSANFHWLQAVASNAGDALSEFGLMLLNEKDFLTSRVASKLNFTGPCVTVQMACASSLAAVHLAARALAQQECDVAVAGGVSLTMPFEGGYLYEDGMVFSPDGRCRPFSAQANGTVPGNGCGVVVLKRLDAAMRDGDEIYAVIKGSALSNDGHAKAGFTAPGVAGQAKVISDALSDAAVPAESICYVEAHGTGTSLGDPIEVAALKEVFAGVAAASCGLGSIKSNIGHLDAAAGVVGLIKAVLSLHHRQLPPTLHVEDVNPELGLDGSPFYIVDERRALKPAQWPLRVGVSSFGMGGANAHVVLEEAPEARRDRMSEKHEIVPLSAGSVEALAAMCGRLASHLEAHPELSLGDIASTLRSGRSRLPQRISWVCTTSKELVTRLREHDASSSIQATVKRPRHAFLFPGQGAHHRLMGQQLDERQPVFREALNRCFEIVHRATGHDLRHELYAPGDAAWRHTTRLVQPMLFSFEYALAKQLSHWGIKASCMLGHSLGEYVAACLAGVFSLKDALTIVIARARLMEASPPGSMIEVTMSFQDVVDILPTELDIAAWNAPRATVVSGASAAVASFAEVVRQRGERCTELRTTRAFHSRLLDGCLKDFAAAFQSISLCEPSTPFISCVTGQWSDSSAVTRAGYWVEQARGTVRFKTAVDTLLASDTTAIIEVGPGRTLSQLVRRGWGAELTTPTFNLCRHPKEAADDEQLLLSRVGQLWQHGARIDWPALDSPRAEVTRRHVRLPTYPFERKQWVLPSRQQPLMRDQRRSRWLYEARWERTRPWEWAQDAPRQGTRWLILMRGEAGRVLAQRLRSAAATVIEVHPGSDFAELEPNAFTVDPTSDASFRKLAQVLSERHIRIDTIVHLWCLSHNDAAEPAQQMLEHGFWTWLRLAQAFGEQVLSGGTTMLTVADGLEEVLGTERIHPAKACLYGFTKIVPLEHDGVDCGVIEVGSSESPEAIAGMAIAAANQAQPAPVTVVRNGFCWQKRFYRIERQLSDAALRTGGVYLVTGGLGGIGLAIAQHLARRTHGTVVLMGRTPLPSRKNWDEVIASTDTPAALRQRLVALRQVEQQAGRVIVETGDVCRESDWQRVLSRVDRECGVLHGVIHAAGVADYEGFIHHRSMKKTAEVLAPKVTGTLLLAELLCGRTLDFVALCSSIGNVVIDLKLGQSGYNAANEFLDAFAVAQRGTSKPRWLSINWTDWKDSGMAVESAAFWAESLSVSVGSLLMDAVTDEEGAELFELALAADRSQVVVSPTELEGRIERARARRLGLQRGTDAAGGDRALKKVSMAPALDDIELHLSRIWCDHFGSSNVDPQLNFFDAGANSLDLVQIHSAIRRRLAVELPSLALFEHPTIAALAMLVRERARGSAEPARSATEPARGQSGKRLKGMATRFKRKKKR